MRAIGDGSGTYGKRNLAEVSVRGFIPGPDGIGFLVSIWSRGYRVYPRAINHDSNESQSFFLSLEVVTYGETSSGMSGVETIWYGIDCKPIAPAVLLERV